MASEISLDYALEALKFGRFQVYLMCLCGAGYAAATIELVLVSLVLPYIQEEWDLTPTTAGFLPTVTFAGELVGGIAWGWIADRYGRRYSFIGTVLFSTLFGMLSAAMPTFEWLLACRFFLGTALGGNLSIDFVMFLEFLAPTRRGQQASIIILFGICGVLITAALGWAALEAVGWRWYLVLCTAPYTLVCLLRLLWKHETPRFHLVSGNTDKALAVLHAIANANGTKVPEGSLQSISTRDVVRGNVMDLWSKELRWLTAGFCFVWFSITLGYYGVTIWLSTFLERKEIPSVEATSNLLYMGLAELPGLLMVNLLIDRIGRRFCLMIALTGCAVSTVLFGSAATQAAVIGWSMAIYFFIVQAWTVVYIYTPEVYPTTLRSTAYGVTGLFGTSAGMISGPLGGAMLEIGSDYVILLIFAGFHIVAAAVSFFLKRETKNQSLADTTSADVDRKYDVDETTPINRANDDSKSDLHGA